LESLKTHPESFGSSYQEQVRLPKLMFEKALEVPEDERFVMGAYDRPSLIGICGFVPGVNRNFPGLSHAGTVIQMYVKPAYRGRHIGLSLVKALADEAFDLPNIDKLVLGVREENKAAIRVYERAGFQFFESENLGEEIKTLGLVKMILHNGG
jgi:ribosomal protein S18 acetylase RimI-like enzyme